MRLRQPDGDTLWGVVPSGRAGSRFLIREYNGVSVIHDAWSGDTHMLDVFAREIFDTLMDAPHSVAALTDAVSSLIPDGTRDDISSRVDGVIAEFDRIGLAAPQPSDLRARGFT